MGLDHVRSEIEHYARPGRVLGGRSWLRKQLKWYDLRLTARLG